MHVAVRSLLPLASLLLVPASAAAGGGDSPGAGWPRWRGPERTGVSSETGWRPDGKDLWRAQVGIGYSSVVVRAGKLYTMGYDQDAGLDVVFCMDATTGEVLWDHAYPSEIWNQAHGGGTVNTPTLEGDRLYTLNREGSFFCLDAATGEVRWEHQVAEELELEPPTWGFAGSPVAVDGKVILNLGRVVAFDADSGEALWDSEDLGHAYSTPTPFEVDGKARLAVFNSGGVAILDRENGDQLFEHPWEVQNRVNASTPVVDGDRLFVSSGMQSGCAMFHVGADGAELLWDSKVVSTSLTGCVLYDGHLYGFDGSQLKCIDLAGEEAWRERGLGSGAFMIADGKLIVVSGKGELVIADADPKGYHELSRSDVLEGGVYWTMPVLADGLIYVRNSLGQLVCRDHRGA